MVGLCVLMLARELSSVSGVCVCVCACLVVFLAKWKLVGKIPSDDCDE